MSKPIKAFFLVVLCMNIQIQKVMGAELKILSSNEFQHIENSTKAIHEDLSKYEINNDELITLFKFKTEKKKLNSVIASLR